MPRKFTGTEGNRRKIPLRESKCRFNFLESEYYDLLTSLAAPEHPRKNFYQDVIDLLAEHLRPTLNILAEQSEFPSHTHSSWVKLLPSVSPPWKSLSPAANSNVWKNSVKYWLKIYIHFFFFFLNTLSFYSPFALRLLQEEENKKEIVKYSYSLFAQLERRRDKSMRRNLII